MLKLKLAFQKYLLKFMRFFLPSLVVICLLGLSCAPAFAIAPPGTANNILDFKTSVHTEGDAAIISGTIPLTNAQTRQQVITNKIVVFTELFNQSWFHWDPSFPGMQNGSYLRSEIFPLGYFTDKNSSNLNKTISLDGLPNGTQFSLDARIGGIGSDLDFEWTYKDTYYEVKILYIDAEGNTLNAQLGNTEYHYDTENGPMIYTSFTIDAPSSAVAFRIQYKNQVRLTNLNLEFYFEDGVHLLNFRYIVNKLEYESALDDYNNSQIGNKLDGIDDTLNDMTNRPVDPELPPDSDKVDDLDQIEDEILDDMAPGFDAVTDVTDQAEQGLKPYLSAFFAFSYMIDELIGVPFFSAITYLSLALGITGTVLGIANSVSIHSERSGSKKKSKGSKGG